VIAPHCDDVGSTYHILLRIEGEPIVDHHRESGATEVDGEEDVPNRAFYMMLYTAERGSQSGREEYFRGNCGEIISCPLLSG
jgi:hypothetical protein